MTTADDDIPDSGAVFTFGKSRFADNTANKFWIRNDKVIQVACGDDHSTFVTESGRLYTFGSNEWGQLGLGHTKGTTKPSSVKVLKQEGVHLVSCGRLHTVVCSKQNRLYAFGAGGEGQLGLGNTEGAEVPKVLPSLQDAHIISISCGTDHSTCLTESGTLFAWGGGSEGQLGLGDETECSIPKQLSIKSRVKQVSCGYYHTAFVTEEGKLFTFGENEVGKLGLGDDRQDSTNVPTQVTSLTGRVYSVSCGNNHTAVITGNDDLYTFGDGGHGQLGLGPSLLQTYIPCKVKRLARHRCQAVSCGEGHTGVVTASGGLYTFGDGRHGKLGQSEESFSNLFQPTRVKRFKGFVVEQVSCGGCHTLVRARRKHPPQDEDSSSSETEEEEHNDSLKSSGPLTMSGEPSENLKILADTIDLNGSLGGTARGRRRQREVSPLPPLARTLPPLSTSTPKSLSHISPSQTISSGSSIDHRRIPSIAADLTDDGPSTKGKQHPKPPDDDEDSDDEDDDDDDDDEDDDEDDDSDEEDEKDEGTNVDEPLSRTYFSRSGHRGDMKPLSFSKHKTKRKEEDNRSKDSGNSSKVSKGNAEKSNPLKSSTLKEVVPSSVTKQPSKKTTVEDDDEEEESEEDDEDEDDDDEDDDDDDEGSESEQTKENNIDKSKENGKSPRTTDKTSVGQSGSKDSEEEVGEGGKEKKKSKGKKSSSKKDEEVVEDEGKGDSEEETEEAEDGDGETKEDGEDKDEPVDQPKIWQFWKKRAPPSPKKTAPDSPTSTNTTPGNQTKSKACAIL